MEKGINNFGLKVINLSVIRNELEEIGTSEYLMMRRLFGEICNDIITKIDNKVDKKELNYEDIKITRFLQWKFWRYYIHPSIFKCGCMWSKHQMSKSVFTTQFIANMENLLKHVFEISSVS